MVTMADQKGYEVQVEALKAHADAVEEQADTWRDVIGRKFTDGEAYIDRDAFTLLGQSLYDVYSGVLAKYGTEYVGGVSSTLTGVVADLRYTARTYGDAEAIVEDTVAEVDPPPPVTGGADGGSDIAKLLNPDE
jgi:hypothetical protein